MSPTYGPSRSSSDRSGSRRPAPRPGLVLDVDRSTPPVLLHHGEQFRLERLPADRSRIIYPPEPLHGIEDPGFVVGEGRLLGNPDEGYRRNLLDYGTVS